MHKHWFKTAHAFTTELDDDSERGPASYERVILTIGGLKCGCCESGISRAFRHFPAIRNPQVNIVLARVEFDLDTSRLSISDVISQLHRATGYTFEKYDQPDGQVLELLVSDPTEIYRAGKPYGVNLVESSTKHVWCPLSFSGRNSTIPREIRSFRYSSPSQDEPDQGKRKGNALYQHTVRIHYDASHIGSRTVFEYYQRLGSGQNLQLAPPETGTSLGISAMQTRRAFLIFLLALAFTLPILVLRWSPIDHNNLVYAHVSLALATLVQIIATEEFVPGAFKTLIHSGVFDMDFLIALSSTTAYIFSVISYVFQIRHKPLETGSFFETATLLVTLILLGRVVSEFARLRAAKSVSFRSLQAETALLVTPKGKTTKIDARLLQYGDEFVVSPHSRIVTDGTVVHGGSEVDESMITGESLPVAKGLGTKVYAGTTNGSGPLTVALTALPHENSVSKIADMVENAELTKPKVQALADRIASWFVPAIAVIGLSVLLIWLFVDRYHSHQTWQHSIVNALTYAIATIIVSCPCAIGLAVPMVILIAGGVSARFGIIFRDPQKLEVARNVTDVVFDKTGTITTGELTVVEAEIKKSPQVVKSMIRGLLKNDKHPVAAAVFQWLEEDANESRGENLRPAEIIDIESVPGNGVKGRNKVNNLVIRAGNPQWLGIKILDSQHTLLCVTIAGVLHATFRLQDRPRHNAGEVVELLKSRGIAVHMISGDSEGAVTEIAHSLGIPKSYTRARQLPADKQAYIRTLQENGGCVIFCGDGTNDSIAIKQADVGVTINHGSDVAKSASDVVFMTARLHNMLILLDISTAAYRRIMFNFGWSALYNIVAILMAAGAFVKVRIPPAYAALGELVSVIPVVLIAFQVRWRNYGKRYRSMDYE
ncbi:E1-E2 ATPase-domain-containing protein [Lophiotrema nucula]|uniref:E1-E2 ATPase-domain-containing protein n=1 Tax=Lophiotrema nucula TaxID=690887 RepID=A0A6A5YX60_9PLEO|nr:E1-E2 ATPase-domain-containing protein [Lophiotrema nucula]